MTLHWRTVDPVLLEPTFRLDITTLLTMSQWDWWVLYGYRSIAEQALLYEKYQHGGPKAAPPGLSPHNYGLAVDVVPDASPDLPGLQPEWHTTAASWEWLFSALKVHPRLESGISFSDADHIQRLGWPRFKEWALHQ